MTDDSPTPEALADAILRETPEDPTVEARPIYNAPARAALDVEREKLRESLQNEIDACDREVALLNELREAQADASLARVEGLRVVGLAWQLGASAGGAGLGIGLLLGWWLL